MLTAPRIIVLLILVLLSGALSGSEASRGQIAEMILAEMSTVSPNGLHEAVDSAPEAVRSIDAAMSLFYASRNHSPAWREGTRLHRLIAALDGLEHRGLDPGVYGVDMLRQRMLDGTGSVEDQTCTDLLATQAYLTALLHLRLGRLNPDEFDPVWHSDGVESLDADWTPIVLLASVMLDDIEGVIEEVRPQTTRYRSLEKAYADLWHRAAVLDWPVIPAGPLLREGMRDPRVPALRQRLSEASRPYPAWTIRSLLHASHVDALYDEELAEAVMAFQRSHHLRVDGIVGPETLKALNVPVSVRLEQVRINLERMRWLARDPVTTYVLVDIAGARLRFVRDGETVWKARAQIGRSARATPRLKSMITHLTFNPTWTVPPTILRDDMLPKIREDISFLERQRIAVLDYAGNRLDPQRVDWHSPEGIMLRQSAGPHNALGRVAIRFPNPFLVYLHDTPSQQGFAEDRRAFSSGCVRVERTMELVNLLIEEGSDAAAEHVAALVDSGRTTNLHLERPVPIRMAYWTADTADDGSLVFRPDIYDHDARIAQAFAEQRANGLRENACSTQVRSLW